MDDKKKILVVDDDEILLAGATVILNADYDVMTALSGKKALELLYNGFIPDLILLDVFMPGMAGFDVFNRIKAISLLQDIPIIFLTSLGGIAEAQYALEIGADDYITKPYSKENLLQRIKGVFAKLDKQ